MTFPMMALWAAKLVSRVGGTLCHRHVAVTGMLDPKIWDTQCTVLTEVVDNSVDDNRHLRPLLAGVIRDVVTSVVMVTVIMMAPVVIGTNTLRTVGTIVATSECCVIFGHSVHMTCGHSV